MVISIKLTKLTKFLVIDGTLGDTLGVEWQH